MNRTLTITPEAENLIGKMVDGARGNEEAMRSVLTCLRTLLTTGLGDTARVGVDLWPNSLICHLSKDGAHSYTFGINPREATVRTAYGTENVTLWSVNS